MPDVSGFEQAVIRRPARPAVAVEADVNRLVQDSARWRERPAPLPDLAPIPASVGAADWGQMQASE